VIRWAFKTAVEVGMSSDATTTGAGQPPEQKRNRRGFLAAAVPTAMTAKVAWFIVT